MGFALCPDEGPPRLWRFVDDPQMALEGIVSKLDQRMNILTIHKPLFDQLYEMDRHRLLRTHARIEYV